MTCAAGIDLWLGCAVFVGAAGTFLGLLRLVMSHTQNHDREK